MHSFSTLSMLALAALASRMPLASGRPAPPAMASDACASGRAVYVVSNNADNAVVAVPIVQDGTLDAARGSSTPTGGQGGNGVDKDGAPAGPDALYSQSAVAVAGKYLFAVNAGSNSVSMFVIDAADPTKLTLVGQPAMLPGEFPTSVAASAALRLVCVGTTGARNGVACAHFSAAGVGAMDALRPLGLNQTTPPQGPANTLSQVFFADDGTGATLFAAVKGDGTAARPGALIAYPVYNARAACDSAPVVAAVGIDSRPNGTALPFGTEPIPGTANIFLTDPSFGAAVLRYDAATAAVTTVARVALPGQRATCWVALSAASHSAWVTDTAQPRLFELALTDAHVLGAGPVDLTASGDPGFTDLRAAGRFLYVLSPGNASVGTAVTIIDTLTRVPAQHVSLTPLGLTRNAQGMAVLL